MILRFIKGLLRSKSIILSIVVVFSLIIIGLFVQIIFLVRDIRSTDLSNNKSIHNHYHHNGIDINEVIDVEDVRDKSKTLLRHRLDLKRKSLKLNNDTNNDTNNDISTSYSKPKKVNHNSIPHAITKSKRHASHDVKDGNVITWYILSIIRIIMSLCKLLYSIITMFILKIPKSRSSYTYDDHVIYYNEESNESDLPHIIQLFRQAKLDWHTLIPEHDSIYERYFHDGRNGSQSFQLKVLKEKSITDYLTRFTESGLSTLYGHDHGILKAYSTCDILRSGCNIHDQKDCNKNQLCYWNKNNEICNEIDDSYTKEAINKCTYPKQFNSNGTIVDVDHSQCKTYTNQRAVILTMEAETQLMFYHFWALWTDIMYTWHSMYLDDRSIHFFIKDVVDPMFFTYFGFISDFCWRRIKNQVPKGVCFCNAIELKPHQSRIEFNHAAEYIINYLNLQDVKPPQHTAKVGIISRRRKRFILNEYKLVKICSDMGIRCELLPLEAMTIFEQIRALRTLDVLVGIHGSGLDNSAFLNKGSTLVQLLPYKVKYRATFKSTALKVGMNYLEWKATDPSLSVFHWDLLEESNPKKLKEYSHDEILEEGQTGSQRETLMFWINQDLIVPEIEWKDLIAQAILKYQIRNISIE